jgi:hypothetical protein
MAVTFYPQAAQPLLHLTNLNPHLAAVMEASGETFL